MVMKTEIADRRLRVRSENSARISAKDLLFAFVGQNKYDYWSNILRINYSHVESQEFNLNLHKYNMAVARHFSESQRCWCAITAS